MIVYTRVRSSIDILRFHVHKVTVTAGIEKPFLMISIAKRDRDVLRFFWVKDIELHFEYSDSQELFLERLPAQSY